MRSPARPASLQEALGTTRSVPSSASHRLRRRLVVWTPPYRAGGVTPKCALAAVDRLTLAICRRGGFALATVSCQKAGAMAAARLSRRHRRPQQSRRSRHPSARQRAKVSRFGAGAATPTCVRAGGARPPLTWRRGGLARVTPSSQCHCLQRQFLCRLRLPLPFQPGRRGVKPLRSAGAAATSTCARAAGVPPLRALGSVLGARWSLTRRM
mmetsp:Transcript_39304/g.108406  ORF Transcript_39304/g.108406 Transcript_39304/m.108406 type:complete len:211 (+) Transcript_39304:1114-1746(+)